MLVSLTVARAPGLSVQVLNAHRHKSIHLARNHPRKEASPIHRPKTIHNSPARCAHVKRSTRVQLPALQPINVRFTPARGTAFLKNFGDRCKRHAARIDTVYYTCGDLHTNLSRSSSGCDQTPPETIPLHSDGLGGEPSAKNPTTPSTPAAESSDQSKQSSLSRLLPWGPCWML